MLDKFFGYVSNGCLVLGMIMLGLICLMIFPIILILALLGYIGAKFGLNWRV